MNDPVLQRREQFRRLAELGQRVGWACIAIAVIAFFVGLATSSLSTWSPVVVVALIACTATLAPGIVLGYAVRAADREDRSG